MSREQWQVTFIALFILGVNLVSSNSGFFRDFWSNINNGINSYISGGKSSSSINLNPFDVGKLPPTAAPGSGQSKGTPGGCPKGYHSGIIGGRYPGCVKD